MYIRYNTHNFRAYEWDPVKRATTLASRKLDFADAVHIFDSPTLEDEDRRRPHGEVRIIAVGVVHARYLTVVYTDRPQPDGRIVRRIISARRSNRRERQAYQDAMLPR